MRLSLNGWPPVASHLACALIGAALAQVGQGPSAGGERPALPVRKALLSLDDDAAQVAGLRPGAAARVARRDGDTICLVGDAKVEVLHTRPQLVIAATLRATQAIAAAAEEAAVGKLALVGAAEASRHASCQKAPQVIYGAR